MKVVNLMMCDKLIGHNLHINETVMHYKCCRDFSLVYCTRCFNFVNPSTHAQNAIMISSHLQLPIKQPNFTIR